MSPDAVPHYSIKYLSDPALSVYYLRLLCGTRASSVVHTATLTHFHL